MAWNPESKTVLDFLTWGGYSSRLRISFPVWCSAAKRGKAGEGREKKGIRKLFLIPSLFTFLPSPFRAYLKPRAHTILPSLHAISRAWTYCWFQNISRQFFNLHDISPRCHVNAAPRKSSEIQAYSMTKRRTLSKWKFAYILGFSCSNTSRK